MDNVKDTQTGLKAIKESSFENIIPSLTIKRFAFDVELLAVANLHGLKIVEMPVQLRLNAPPKTKEILKMFIDLLRITYRVRVLQVNGKTAYNINSKYSKINRGLAIDENSGF